MTYEHADKIFDTVHFTQASGQANKFSAAYIDGTRTLMQQTADHDGTSQSVLLHQSGADLAFTRRTRQIDQQGNVIGLTSQSAVLRPFITGVLFHIRHVQNTPFIQAMRQEQAGSGPDTSAWFTNGIRGPTITPAFGSNHYQAASNDGDRFMYVPGIGVYVFQGGTTGSSASSTAIALYPTAAANSMPSSVAVAAIETDPSQGQTQATCRMLGYDHQNNIYTLRGLQSGDVVLRSYTPDLSTLRFTINLGTTIPTIGGNWGNQAQAVLNNGGLFVTGRGSPGDGKNLHVFDISNQTSATYLGAVFIADQVNATSLLWAIDDCEVFFKAVPSVWSVGECDVVCADVGLDQIVYDLARRAGIPSGRINVAAIAPDSDYPSVWGIGIGRPASARGIIEIAQRYGFFDLADIGGRLIASRRDRLPNGNIGGDDLRGHVYGETPPTIALREREEDYELPRQIRVQYSQAQAEYEPGVEGYSRRVTDADTVVDVDLSAIAMDPDRAAIISEVATVEAIVHREITDVTLVATPANKDLKPGDIKTLVIGNRQEVVRIIELGYTYPGLIKLKVVRHDPSVYHTDAVGAGRRLFGSVTFIPGTTTFELLDAPLVREFDEAPGYFAALGGNPTIPGLIEGWPGGDLERLEPSGWEKILQILRPGSSFGFAITALGDAPHTIVTDDELVVSSSSPLESVTLQEALRGANLVALGVIVDGIRVGWELIRFLNASFDSTSGHWALSGLIRGVNGTEWATGMHQPGDRFVVIDGAGQIFTDLATELNVERIHNAATIGSLSDPAFEIPFTWTGVDRIPYAVAHPEAERDTGDDILITWFRRDRVGMELQSGQVLPLSEASEAYEVDVYDTDGTTILRTLSVSTPEVTYTSAQQTSDFGSLPAQIDIAIYQIGALGRGYPARITLEV